MRTRKGVCRAARRAAVNQLQWGRVDEDTEGVGTDWVAASLYYASMGPCR